MSALAPHQQRVIDELNELAERTAKLSAFMGTPIYAALDEAEQQRLAAQLGVMGAYIFILNQRIAAF